MLETYETFHLVAEYFPQNTRKALPTSMILEYGVLPLGFKTKFRFFRKSRNLNLGFLNPESKTALDSILLECKKSLGPETFTDIQIYKLKPEEFLETLEAIYHVDRDALRKVQTLDPTLSNFLKT